MTPKSSRTNNTHLKPPERIENNENDSINGVYMIHVSRFHINTTEMDIQKHILDNTNISNSDTFKINKLISQREENKNKYASFKITTLKRDDYTKIINENIWLPDFQARDYKDNNFETRTKKRIDVVNNTPNNRKYINDNHWKSSIARNKRQNEVKSHNLKGREFYNNGNRYQTQSNIRISTPKTYANRAPYGPQYMVPNGIIQYPHQPLPQFSQINSNFPHFWIPTQPPNQMMNQVGQSQTNQIQQTNHRIK